MKLHILNHRECFLISLFDLVLRSFAFLQKFLKHLKVIDLLFHPIVLTYPVFVGLHLRMDLPGRLLIGPKVRVQCEFLFVLELYLAIIDVKDTPL